MDYFELSVQYAYTHSLMLITRKDANVAVVMFAAIIMAGLIAYGLSARDENGIRNTDIIKKSMWLAILLPYMYLVFAFTVINRPELGARFSELTPFWSYREVMRSGNKKLLLECILNVCMLVPFGFLLRLLKVRFSHAVLLGALFSYSIEISQYLTERGLFELFDDPFNNVLGAAVGYLVCKWFIKGKSDKTYG